MNKPPSPAEAAEFLRLSLVARIIEPRQVEDWATAALVADAEAGREISHPAVVRLALATHLDRALVQDELRALAQTAPALAADTGWALFCLRLHADLSAGLRSTGETVLLLHHLDKLLELPAGLSGPVCVLEDAWSLARDQVYGTLDEVRDQTLRLLACHFDDEVAQALAAM
ncbi:MAG: hypothetical protein ACO1TE_12485 [Prosthecobacter sp.]